MADTTEARMQLLLQETGGNSNTWGENLNDNFEKISEAVGGVVSYVVTGGTFNLSDDQQRYALIEFTGTLTADQVVELNDEESIWHIVNSTSGDYTLEFKTDSGNAGGNVEVIQGTAAFIYSDGTDVKEGGIVQNLIFGATSSEFGDGTNSFLVSVSVPDGETAEFAAATDSSLRWAWGKDDSDETGSNVGSGFSLAAYSDSGTLLYQVMTAPRATGEVAFPRGLNFGDTSRSIRFANSDMEFEYDTDTYIGLNELRDGIGQEHTINVTFNGNGGVIQTGYTANVRLPWACTVIGVTLLADQSGSAVVDIWADSLANYPPTDADSITASAPPTLSSATNSEDTTLTGWTTSLSEGDVLIFNVDSATTVQQLTVSLKVVQS